MSNSPDPSGHPAATPSRRPRKRWIILAAIAALLTILWLVNRGRTNSQLAALRRSGLPVTLAELEAWHPLVPATNNAAILIGEAMQARIQAGPNDTRLPIVSSAKGAPELPPLGAPVPEEMREAIRRHLELNAETLEKLHAAAALTQSRYPANYLAGFTMLLPHLAPVKSLTQLLKLEAVLASAEGDAERGVKAVTTSFALAHSLATEPLLISQLVRIACVAISVSSLEELLSRQPLTDAQLLRLLQTLREAEADEAVGTSRAMAGERCFGIDCFTMPPGRAAQALINSGAAMGSGPSATPTLAALGMTLYRLTGLHDRDFRLYLRHMQSLVDGASLAFPERIQEGEKLATQLDRSLGQNRLAIISRMVLPALGKALEKGADAVARVRLAETAVALERFRLAHGGKLPQQLIELAPQFIASLPTDPFDGQPLNFEARPEGGYRIWGDAYTAVRTPKTPPSKGTKIKADFVVAR